MKTRSEVLAEKKLPLWERGANAEQLEVIRHENGPVRVLASAGSGKTFAVTRRMVRLASLGIVSGDRILAVTFSKKAADEMNKRVKDLGVGDARVGTWHSLCLQVLRQGNTKWADWEIDGSDDRPQKAKYILKDVLGFKQMNWRGADLGKVNNFITHCKANLAEPDSIEAAEMAKEMFPFESNRVLEAFALYNCALEEKRLLTFDDFLVFAHQHLATNEEARLEWAGKWDQLLCDEVQDNNKAQSTFAKLLARDHGNYMAVGDCFQSIYGFRGSSPDYLANFEQEWSGAKTIWLPRNYRSGKKIIEAANDIVRPAKITNLEPKDMIGERDHEGHVRILCAEAHDDEANEVVEAITKSVAAGDTKLADHTVLFRTNAQSRAVEEALLKKRVPYVVVGGTSFYERREVRDLLAYLRLAAGCAKIDDVKRSINTPFRFLGAKFVARIMEQVNENAVENTDWPTLVEEVSNQERLQDRQRKSAREWAEIVRMMQKDIANGSDAKATEDQKFSARPSTLLEAVVRSTRYIDWLQQEEGEETIENSGPANVREMVRVAERFSTAKELLNYIDETIRSARKQREDKQAGGQRVLLMSVHRSKGLEWPHVYVVGMNEMVLPHFKGDIEEERRLAYVAVTRARDVLTLSYVRRIATRAGVKDVQPSRFIVETGLGLDVPNDEMHVGPGGLLTESAALPELPPLP